MQEQTTGQQRLSAKRVKDFFISTPIDRYTLPIPYSKKYFTELLANHQFLSFKSVSLLEKLRPASSKPRTKKVTSTPSSASSALSGFIANPSSEERRATPHRIRGWRFKESFLLKKYLTHHRLPPRPHTITPFQDDLTPGSLAHTREWQDLLRSKEESQFQITRITKILSS